MNKPTLIFDFDGTIADTHKYIVTIFNRLASEFKYKIIQPDQVEFLKNKTSKEIISILEIPVMKIPAILSRSKKEFLKDIDHLKPFDGIIHTLHKITESKTSIGILSSNAKENITAFLNIHNFTDIFSFIATTSKVWSKNTALKRLIKTHNFNLSDIIYVGDETRDITAARKLGIKVAAVTWGYNSKNLLSEHNPDFLIEKPKDLLNLI